MGLTNTRRILKLILKPKPVSAFMLMSISSFEITPSALDPLFNVPQDRPGDDQLKNMQPFH
ncbi:hypothetical protein BDR05DRAFT_964758 [Suillus weaverae]|nr:hypothetical protein BDR05DRAFT_964758 [Suillus weaverae]